jgi:hypothetical protein
MRYFLRVLVLIAAPLSAITGAEAATILMPAGSTVWMKTTSSTTCWPTGAAGADDCIASNQLGAGNGIPNSTFTSGDNTTVTQAEVLPDQIRGFVSGRSSVLTMSFEDTYTVHGTLPGPFDITVELNATGEMRGLTPGSLTANVIAEIGTFNPDPNDIPEQFRLNPFPGSPNASRSDLVVGLPASTIRPFDITASHTLTDILIGDTFTLGFGVTLFAVVAQIDMLNTAGISFVLPDGVFLTSALGGEFGVQANAVPLPAALPLFAGGLGVLAFLARRRKRKA